MEEMLSTSPMPRAGPPTMIEAHAIGKTFNDPQHKGRRVDVLKGISFSVASGDFYVLLGSSGCGKTTTLRAIAGLERPEDGAISIGDQEVFSASRGIFVQPEDRSIAMVFQSYGLWPHMNVRGNIEFPLLKGRRRVGAVEARRRLDRALQLLHLTDYIDRPVFTLSGGQQQRVALARAIALEPKVLLMDEPLSNLDARLRTELRVELKELTRAVGITTVYVTHDQVEAMVMGDRIAVMKGGRIIQEGSATELYQHPQDLFVANFLGDMSFIAGQVVGTHNNHVRVSTAVGDLSARGVGNLAVGCPVQIGFRPEDTRLDARFGDNIFTGKVEARHYVGDAYLYQVRLGAAISTARLSKYEEIAIGTDVALHVAPNQCVAFGLNAG
jgi:ABC-type sugar transport system ATPase subunit